MAFSTPLMRATTRMTEPSREQINKTAEEIRRSWTPAERRRRHEQARSAQRRLVCLALAIAA